MRTRCSCRPWGCARPWRTNTAVNGLAMEGATLFVLLMLSVLISAMRHWIPKAVRISTYIIVIATFVTVADFTLQAAAPAVHRELGAFISLIVVNCLILGRQEAFASKHTVRLAAADAAGMGGGFAFALVLLGGAREVLGKGSLFGVALFAERFEPWVIMILPPGASSCWGRSSSSSRGWPRGGSAWLRLCFSGTA